MFNLSIYARPGYMLLSTESETGGDGGVLLWLWPLATGKTLGC